MISLGNRLHDNRTLISLLAILLGVFAALGLLGWVTTMRSDGLAGYLEAGGYRVTHSFRADGLVRADDLIVAIGGKPLDRDLNRPGLWARFLYDRSGAFYTVERAGETRRLQVSWEPLTLQETLRRLAPYGLIALVFFGSLVVGFFESVDTPALSLLLAGAWVQGINELLNGIPWLGANVNVTLAWLYGPLVLMSFSLANSLLLHILLVYPERKRWVTRYPRAPFGFHALNLLLALLAWWGPGPGSLLANRVWIVRTIMQPVTGIEVFFGAGSLIHTYVRSRRHGVRNQVPWLMWGVLVGPSVWLLLYNLPITLWGHPWLPLWAADLPLVLIVLSFAISMSRRALMMVDLWINRALVYGVLSGVVVGLFLLMMYGLVPLLGVDPLSASIFTVALIAVVVPPLHRAIQQGINHLFFREWLSARMLLQDVSRELSTTLETDALARILVTELPRRLRVTQAALFLQQPDGNLKAVDDSSGWPIPPDHPLLQALAEVRYPLILSQARDLSPVLRALRDENWEIILPLRSGGALVGLYLLGLHLSGEFYGRNEVETLALLGERIALTLENARLYEEIERYSEDLERLVRQRTEALQDANRALSVQRDRLQVILQNIADGLVYITDEGEIALVNTAFEAMVGQTGDAMVGMSPVDAHIPSFITELAHEARAAPGMVIARDWMLDDQVVRLSIVGLPERGGVIAVIRDITRDVEVDRMKSQFFSVVSHELRTPLTSILGFAKVTRRFVDDRLIPSLETADVAPELGERVRQNLEIVTTEGQRLMGLIDDMLEITALDAGTADWDDRPCALPALIQDAVETQRDAAEAKGLTLLARMAQDLPTMIVDPERVTQLLRNLISHAIKRTQDGEIRLSVRWLEPGTQIQGWRAPEPGAVWVAVHDTGEGFGLDQKTAYVFERFGQVEALMEAQPTGAELGLAICQEIVSHYDGILWIEPDPDRGSTFSFTLPARKQREPVA